MATVDVLDSFINYTDTGAGPVPVVFLHGNPTSSHLWRNVIPHVAAQTRVLAPDLIGMGASGKPDSDYRLADQARYLDAWFDALGLDQVVIVGHDWGGTLGMHWAARHPDRIRGIALIETFLRPMRWDELPPLGAELFRKFRTAEGERMVLAENMFIEFNLPRGLPICRRKITTFTVHHSRRRNRASRCWPGRVSFRSTEIPLMWLCWCRTMTNGPRGRRRSRSSSWRSTTASVSVRRR